MKHRDLFHSQFPGCAEHLHQSQLICDNYCIRIANYSFTNRSSIHLFACYLFIYDIYLVVASSVIHLLNYLATDLLPPNLLLHIIISLIGILIHQLINNCEPSFVGVICGIEQTAAIQKPNLCYICFRTHFHFYVRYSESPLLFWAIHLYGNRDCTPIKMSKVNFHKRGYETFHIGNGTNA